VHPALLIMTAPEANKANVVRSGKHPVGAAKAIDHPHGQNSRNDPLKKVSLIFIIVIIMCNLFYLPIGLSNLINRTYGLCLNVTTALVSILLFILLICCLRKTSFDSITFRLFD
jgi:hypothetical protein